MIEIIDRYKGCLLGLAVGDAVGTTYGIDGIPKEWLNKLTMRNEIEEMAVKLYERTIA